MSPRPDCLTPCDLICEAGSSLEEWVGKSAREIRRLDRRDFAAEVLGRLELTNRAELSYLLQLDRSPRRFQAFGIGLMKTGTTSLAEILWPAYRARREFLGNDTGTVLAAYLAGRIGREALRDFVRCRGLLAHLEMDSAFFNYLYVDLLRELWPGARFVFLFRDCYAWLDSMLDFLANPELRGLSQRINSLLLGIEGLDRSCGRGIRTPVVDYIDGLLEYWASATRSLRDAMDPRDSLLMRTEEISRSTQSLASFLGIPHETLASIRSHSNATSDRYGFLGRIASDLFESLVDRHCGDLMTELFPECCDGSRSSSGLGL